MIRSPWVFLAGEGLPSTVFDAQVGDALRSLARAGLTFDMVGFDPLYPLTLWEAPRRRRLAEFRRRLPGRLAWRPFVPYEDRLGSPLALAQLERLLGSHARWVIHARGLPAADLARRLCRLRPGSRYVYDVRGDYLAEHRFHWRGNGEAPTPEDGRLQALERRVVGEAGAVLCVSQHLADLLVERAGARPPVVVPCSHDPAKFGPAPRAGAQARQRLGLDPERRLLVYVGSLVAYQLPRELAALCGLAVRRLPQLDVLFLTPQVAEAEALLERAGVPAERRRVLRARHDDVPGLLNAADAALLLRRPDPVNRAASPTKVAEYLACGLPIVLSPGIGDYDRLFAAGLAIPLEDPDQPEPAVAALAELLASPPPRDRIAAWAQEHLARDRFLPRLLAMYRSLRDR